MRKKHTWSPRKKDAQEAAKLAQCPVDKTDPLPPNPTMEQIAERAREIRGLQAKAPVKAKDPVCSTCSDTHFMTKGEGSEPGRFMCTFCPRPCEECRRHLGAYCEHTPCGCPCHRAMAGRCLSCRKIMDPEDQKHSGLEFATCLACRRKLLGLDELDAKPKAKDTWALPGFSPPVSLARIFRSLTEDEALACYKALARLLDGGVEGLKHVERVVERLQLEFKRLS